MRSNMQVKLQDQSKQHSTINYDKKSLNDDQPISTKSQTLPFVDSPSGCGEVRQARKIGQFLRLHIHSKRRDEAYLGIFLTYFKAKTSPPNRRYSTQCLIFKTKSIIRNKARFLESLEAINILYIHGYSDFSKILQSIDQIDDLPLKQSSICISLPKIIQSGKHWVTLTSPT